MFGFIQNTTLMLFTKPNQLIFLVWVTLVKTRIS